MFFYGMAYGIAYIAYSVYHVCMRAYAYRVYTCVHCQYYTVTRARTSVSVCRVLYGMFGQCVHSAYTYALHIHIYTRVRMMNT
jgi:hypothetical protein